MDLQLRSQKCYTWTYQVHLNHAKCTGGCSTSCVETVLTQHLCKSSRNLASIRLLVGGGRAGEVCEQWPTSPPTALPPGLPPSTFQRPHPTASTRRRSWAIARRGTSPARRMRFLTTKSSQRDSPPLSTFPWSYLHEPWFSL